MNKSKNVLIYIRIAVGILLVIGTVLASDDYYINSDTYNLANGAYGSAIGEYGNVANGDYSSIFRGNYESAPILDNE